MKPEIQVTPEECEQIKLLFMRKLALKELVYTMGRAAPQESHDIYERVIHDLGETCWSFDSWWVEMTKKYNLEGKMEINFDTGRLSREQ
jgi:CXXX repeat modification system protein